MASNRLQGAIFTVMVVRVVDPYDPALDQEISRQVELSPRFFADAPAVIDLGDCLGCTAEADFEGLKQTLRKHRLVPGGRQRVTPVQPRPPPPPPRPPAPSPAPPPSPPPRR